VSFRRSSEQCDYTSNPNKPHQISDLTLALRAVLGDYPVDLVRLGGVCSRPDAPFVPETRARTTASRDRSSAVAPLHCTPQLPLWTTEVFERRNRRGPSPYSMIQSASEFAHALPASPALLLAMQLGERCPVRRRKPIVTFLSSMQRSDSRVPPDGTADHSKTGSPAHVMQKRTQDPDRLPRAAWFVRGFLFLPSPTIVRHIPLCSMTEDNPSRCSD
jgi:hypothetical protein